MKLFLNTFYVPLLFLTSCTSSDRRLEQNSADRVVHYYPDGKIQEIKYFKDSLLNGECFLFYPDGKLEQKVTYKDNKVNGHVYFFYNTGVLKSHKFYIDGKIFGNAVDYFDDTVGLIKSILMFNENGKLYYRKEFDSLGNVIKVEGKKW